MRKKRDEWLRSFFVEAARRISGVKRWETASQMWHDAVEFKEMGKKHYDTKGIA